jgi:4-diphosphocytidyl-2-C-methyl-D-erythritol kinase
MDITNLKTIFVLLDFFDEITIEKTTDKKITRLSGNEDILESDDLMIKSRPTFAKNHKFELWGKNIHQ